MLDSDPTVPWKAKGVRHIDGASGAKLAPVHDMPGSFKVQFHDGIITNQKANVLLIDGKPLDKLMESFDYDDLLEEQQQFAEIWKSRGFRIPPAEMAPSEIIRGLKHHVRLRE